MSNLTYSMPWKTYWSGEFALWTGHKTGPNVYSMVAPTHSSVVGFLMSVLGHRGMRWSVHEVKLLRLGGRLPVSFNGMKRFPEEEFFVEKHRTPRTYTILTDVAYEVTSSIHMSTGAKPGDNLGKFNGMFQSRMKQGKVRDSWPYFGQKEFMVSEFRLVSPDEELEPLPINEDLGICPFGQDFEDPKAPWYYHPLQVTGGTVTYPTWEQVREYGLRRDTV